jgi:hypothetical protein
MGENSKEDKRQDKKKDFRIPTWITGAQCSAAPAIYGRPPVHLVLG